MNEENVLIITDKAELYDKCENIEELFDKYYLPLVETHFKKTYQLQQENQQLKDQLKQRDEVIDETIGMLDKLDTDIMQNTIIGFQQFLPRFYEIKEILQRYRGDNK